MHAFEVESVKLLQTFSRLAISWQIQL